MRPQCSPCPVGLILPREFYSQLEYFWGACHHDPLDDLTAASSQLISDAKNKLETHFVGTEYVAASLNEAVIYIMQEAQKVWF
jgi:hypothetical protein